MSIERVNIGGGININLIETDKFKTNYIGVKFNNRLGDNAAKNALLFKVLMQGSKKYPTVAVLCRELDFLYSWVDDSLFKTGEIITNGLCASMLDNKYAIDGSDIFSGVMDIIGDLLFNPLIVDEGFNPDYVENEKINLKDEIRAQINNKRSYAVRRCKEIMCAGEAFAVNELGTEKDLDEITAQGLYEHYKYVISSYDVEIYFVGEISDKKQLIINKFKEIFAGVQRGSIEDYSTEVIRSAVYKGETVEEMQVNQGKLVLGFRSGTILSDEDYASLVLFNEIYGGSPTSKLFENVREKLSLCYYCSSSPESNKGVLFVSSGIEVDKKEQAQAEILRQLDEIKEGNFSEKDITDAKAGLISSYKGVYDNAFSIERWYTVRRMGGKIITPEEASANVEKVTAQQIREAAKKISLDTVYFLKGTLTGGEANE